MKIPQQIVDRAKALARHEIAEELEDFEGNKEAYQNVLLDIVNRCASQAVVEFGEAHDSPIVDALEIAILDGIGYYDNPIGYNSTDEPGFGL